MITKSICNFWIMSVIAFVQCSVIRFEYTLQPIEAAQIQKTFYGIENQFFVDIGAFHPINRSNTLQLKVMNWRGINVDANYQQIQYFHSLRLDDLNLNYAVSSEPNTYAQIYINKSYPSISSIWQKLPDNQTLSKTMKIPTISSAAICQRYYIKRPAFMNIDVQGFSSFALDQNNWNLTKCRPEIILIQMDKPTQTNNFLDSEMMLKKLGYQSLAKVALGQMWADKDVISKYKQIRRINEQKKINKMVFLRFASVCDRFVQKNQKFDNSLGSVSFNNFISKFYVYFAKRGQNLHIQALRQQSNSMTSYQQLIDRPIIIFQFISSRGKIIVQNQYKQSKLFVSENQNYYVLKDPKSKFEVYIFDHETQNPEKLLYLYNFNQDGKGKESNQYEKYFRIILLILVLFVFVGVINLYLAFKHLKMLRSSYFKSEEMQEFQFTDSKISQK